MAGMTQKLGNTPAPKRTALGTERDVALGSVRRKQFTQPTIRLGGGTKGFVLGGSGSGSGAALGN